MTEQELDRLFKDALDHPVEGADPTAAWAEAEAMINKGVGRFSPAMKLRIVFFSSVMLTVTSLAVFNSRPVIEFERSELSFYQVLEEEVLLAEGKRSSTTEIRVATRLEAPVILEKQGASILPASIPTQEIQSFIAPVEELSGLIARAEQVDIPASNGVGETELPKEPSSLRESLIHEAAQNRLAESLTPLTVKGFVPGSERDLLERRSFGEDDFVKKPKAANFIALTAGATLSNGIVRENDGFSNVGTFQRVGLIYSHGLTSKISASAGIEYYSMSGKGLELSYDSVNYSFGYSQTTHTIRPNSLHYLSIPIQVDFEFARRHHLSVGGDFAYLMNVHSDLDQVNSGDFTQQTTVSKGTWGYLAGLKDFNATASAAYAYSLSDQIDLRAMMNYRLMNIHERADADQLRRLRYSLGVVIKLKQFE